jgi:hypothetical protein
MRCPPLLELCSIVLGFMPHSCELDALAYAWAGFPPTITQGDSELEDTSGYFRRRVLRPRDSALPAAGVSAEGVGVGAVASAPGL